MFTYAIADLHGRYDLLPMAYNGIMSHATREADDIMNPGTIVHLGDYVDRGPKSKQILEFLMDPNTIPHGFKRVVLKGNHEEIMYVTCKGLQPGWWLSNGGAMTLLSYGHALKGKVDCSIVPQSHLDWIDKLPLMHVDQHRVFVHAGVDKRMPLEDQDHEKLTWMLYHDSDPGGHFGRHVVHGHHQHEDGPKLYEGRTNLDTCAYFTGRLVIGIFDDAKAGGPVDFIEVTGQAADA